MKLSKLISQTEEFLSSEGRKRKEKKKYLKQVLKKLRDYEEELNQRLEEETDLEVIEKLERKIALAHAQRKKGVTVLKSLKKNNDNTSE